MKYIPLLFCLPMAVIAAPTEDEVIAKLDDGGPRYQNMSGPENFELVDLWLTQSDLDKSDCYDPALNNTYHLFTRYNPENSRIICLGCREALITSNYNADKKTVVLIHGWQNNRNSTFNVLLRKAYLICEDVNLIMVDWSKGADTPYLVAMNNDVKSGKHVAKFITWLLETTSGDIDDFHIIGHSLGAHQAGIVGRHLGGKVPYITGLDPAMPGWIGHPQALSKDVSLYTEVIHTDVGMSGIVTPAGHVDFYPNRGRDNPGCDTPSCNHHRAVLFMAESLKTGGFTSHRCESFLLALTGICDEESLLQMGGPNPKTGFSGAYYLTTNAESPFSKG